MGSIGLVVYRLVDGLIQLLELLIFANALLSWFATGKRNRWIELIFVITEPILAPCRKLLQKINLGLGNVDFSPILALVILELLVRPLVGTIIRMIFAI